MKNFFHIISFSLCITLCCEPNKPVENFESQEPLQEGLVILLDRNNLEFINSAAPSETLTCAYALLAHSPILVSRSILANVLLSKERPITPLRNQLVEQNTFNNWIIKELDDYYILIPKDRLQILENYLNITMLREISIDDIKKEYDSFIKYVALSGYGMVVKDIAFQHLFSQRPPIQALSKLFSPQSPQTPAMLWSIFLAGHGMYKGYLAKGSIADLSINEFQDLLNFLESKIKTKNLIYSSCYAGGSNKIKAFNNALEKDISKIYSFPIIILSVTEAVSYAVEVNFDMLFNLLFKETYTLPNYYQILQDAGFLRELLNFPQIRLPGSSWFSVENLNTLPHNKDYAIISRVKGLTQDKEMRITPSQRIIFVYSPLIPFPIKIEDPSLFRSSSFSFMASGVSQYHFAEIETQRELTEVIRSLAAVAKETPLSYRIYIDKLSCVYRKKITTFNTCILDLKPGIFTKNYSAKFYATIMQEDGSLITGKYDVVFIPAKSFSMYKASKKFILTNEDYSKKFAPAPPFEHQYSLKKAIAQKVLQAKTLPQKELKTSNTSRAEFNKKRPARYIQTRTH